MDYIFVNNSLETYTIDGSGAIATHIASVRAAARRDGVEPWVLTRRDTSRSPLDEGPTHSLAPLPRLPTLLMRVARKGCRLAGWQSHHERWHAHQVLRALRRSEADRRRVLVLHNDPDVADFLAARLRHDVIVHVWHNVLPHGRSRNQRVRQLAVSHYLAEAVAELAGSVPHVATNGVDASVFFPADRRKDALTVSFLGRTGKEKGPDILLRALLELPETVKVDRLLLIGSNAWGECIEDPYQQLLSGLVSRLEARGTLVERTGHLGRRSVASILRTSDVHVVPSRWEDPAPLVLIEAMATGLCPIAARSGGMPEYGGDAVLWFEREDIEGLTVQLVRVLTDSALREDFRARARARAGALTWDRTWATVRGTSES